MVPQLAPSHALVLLAARFAPLCHPNAAVLAVSPLHLAVLLTSTDYASTLVLTKAKELVHTVLVGEHTHPGQNGNGRKKAKKEKDDDSSSSSSSDDEGEVTEREQIVETVTYTIA